MSVLKDKIKLYFGFGCDERPVIGHFDSALSDEEKLGMAAAARGFAFDLLEQAEEALMDALAYETEVLVESLHNAQRSIDSSSESAARIIASGITASLGHKEMAAQCARNADGDDLALAMLASLFAHHDDAESPNGPGPMEGI